MTKMRGRKGGRGNTPQSVVVVDGEGGAMATRIDSQIRQMENSESDISVLCIVRSETSSSTAPVTGKVDFATLVNDDTFTSLSAQYRTFRVAAIKFDVYDVRPTVLADSSYFSTYHGIAAGGDNAENVVDGADSKIIPPGVGKATFYWWPSSLQEKNFQSVGSFDNLGGLRYYLGGAPGGAAFKYTVVAKFIVHFRSRL